MPMVLKPSIYKMMNVHILCCRFIKYTRLLADNFCGQLILMKNTKNSSL